MDVSDVISISKPSIARTNVIDSDVEMSDTETNGAEQTSIVTPGELVTDDPVWMKGHGTYFLNDNIYSSVAGNVSRVNRLLSAKQDAILMLGSVNLPGGVLRRKSESDELQMRNFLKEGDLLNAEVQSVFSNGSASLHTRSLKYGKLRNGIFLTVPSRLVVKSKNHTHKLSGDVSVILGINGFIWLSKTSTSNFTNNESNIAGNRVQSAIDGQGSYNPGVGSVSITRLEEESSWEIYSDKNEFIPTTVRDTITRYYNVIRALSYGELGITDQRITMGYQASLQYANVGKLVDKDAMEQICDDVITNEKMRGNL
ncbi:Exosome complex component rrp4 [Yamadazyma tenuis]|uniref:Exosome complex component rrp4 n=1 Tax=Candida tenuis TaxID=2315449 RepID=UPI0027A42545|nr:Exosome complex component rrp4 [Yamadazyma tenuis]